MPWAANGVAGHQSVDERAVVVRPMRVNSEDLRPAAHKQHLRIAAMTDQLAAVRKIGKSDASRQIGPNYTSVLSGHSLLLCYRDRSACES